jgi:hypothetical protein
LQLSSRLRIFLQWDKNWNESIEFYVIYWEHLGVNRVFNKWFCVARLGEEEMGYVFYGGVVAVGVFLIFILRTARETFDEVRRLRSLRKTN